jgi:peptidoglycan/xylan/chitin deacetylase (PgdA/CDA1 family)
MNPGLSAEQGLKNSNSKTIYIKEDGGGEYLSMKTFLVVLLIIAFLPLSALSAAGELKGPNGKSRAEGVPILLYHRFGEEVADSMTVTTTYFASQLKYFKDQGYTVIPLRQLVDYHLGKKVSLPPRSLVLTADDGHKSVYTDMFPLLKKYHVPATLFLYPSALSNAPYAMTWEQLKEMKATGLVDMQSHTFWHPNFKKEKRNLSAGAYQNLVESQLRKAKAKLEKEFNARVDMLAWPFGIYDEGLIEKAAEAGYVAGFTMERRDAAPSDNLMALPRYLMAGRTGKNGGAGILPRNPEQRAAAGGGFKE